MIPTIVPVATRRVPGVLFACVLSYLAWSYAAAPASAQPATPEPATEPGAADASEVRPRAEPGRAVPLRPPPRPPVMPKVEDIERPRISGFWTSTRPARGGAYRYRLLAIGVVIALLTLGFMLWLIRKKTRAPDTAATGIPAADADAHADANH